MRVARIEVGWDFLLRQMHGHELTKVVTDVPDDARVLAVDLDPSRRCLYLTVESATFAEVPEGAVMPEFHPVMTISVTEMSMLADLVSKRHDAWMEDKCAQCDKPVHLDHRCPS